MSKQTAITKSARGETCSLRFPMVCNFDNETTVWAHLPSVDKGIGYKSPDWWGVYACSCCHDVLDGRSSRLHYSAAGGIWEMVMDGLYETLKKLIAKGLLRVKGV